MVKAAHVFSCYVRIMNILDEHKGEICRGFDRVFVQSEFLSVRSNKVGNELN